MKTCYCVKNTILVIIEVVGAPINQTLPLDMVQSCQYMECNDSDGIGRHSVALYMCLLNNGKLVLAVCFAPDCCDHQSVASELAKLFLSILFVSTFFG